MRLAGNISILWAQWLAGEAYRRARLLLDTSGPDGPERNELLVAAGWLAWWYGDVAGFNELATTAAETAERTGDAELAGHAKLLLGQRLAFARDPGAPALMAEGVADLDLIGVPANVIEYGVVSDVLGQCGDWRGSTE